MTDERVANAALLVAARRLPRGAGIIFRHDRLSPVARRALFDRVRRVAAKRGLMLLLAGSTRLAHHWRADGVHVRRGPVRGRGRLVVSRPAHNAFELTRARQGDLIFLSPVFATRSHPGARPLGRGRFATLARLSRAPVIALGGMTAQRFAGLTHAHGWAAIDALTPE